MGLLSRPVMPEGVGEDAIRRASFLREDALRHTLYNVHNLGRSQVNFRRMRGIWFRPRDVCLVTRGCIAAPLVPHFARRGNRHSVLTR